MKIRFTKDCIFGIKAKEEYDVGCPNTAPRILIERQNGRESVYLYLDDLKGFYEVVRWKPKEGQGYNYVDEAGCSDYAVWRDTEIDLLRYGAGNCEQDNLGGRERSMVASEKIRKIYKEAAGMVG